VFPLDKVAAALLKQILHCPRLRPFA
jgi:hypothetical protein